MKARDRKARAIGFLSRFRKDVRGNALMIAAAALLPMLGVAGSAIDMARLYVVRVRLQQACDAGVLAGRKFMDETNTSSTLEPNTATQAKNFFDNNFQLGWFGTKPARPQTFMPSKVLVEGNYQVAGTASVLVPMTLMAIFGSPTRGVVVACQAIYEDPDANVMFVLDTTGSMACQASDSISSCNGYVVGNTQQNGDGSWSVAEKSNSRIAAVRRAVMTFYNTMSTNKDSSTHLRFGVVPYSTSVNIGYDLPSGSLVSSWHYQSRTQNSDDVLVSTTNSSTATTQAACVSGRTPGDGYGADSRYTVYTRSWSGGTCTTAAKLYQANFTYGNVPNVDVSGYITGAAVNTPGVALPIGSGVTRPTSTWNGCVEERDTTVTASPSTSTPPLDLDVTTAPSDDASRWRPMWPDAVYLRSAAGTGTEIGGSSLRDYSSVYNTRSDNGRWSLPSDHYSERANMSACPKRVMRLTDMTDSGSPLQNYVNAADFRPHGYTYHDTGMVWATRMLVHGGLFSGDSDSWPGRSIGRYIVFLTDGDMETNPTLYGAHGVEQHDQRVTGGAYSQLTAYHNARFAASCTIAKNHGIHVFVVAYAQTMTSTLQNCADANSAFYASNDAQLQAAFASIAQRVAMLRLSQ